MILCTLRHEQPAEYDDRWVVAYQWLAVLVGKVDEHNPGPQLNISAKDLLAPTRYFMSPPYTNLVIMKLS
jgi:hypothetical protein